MNGTDRSSWFEYNAAERAHGERNMRGLLIVLLMSLPVDALIVLLLMHVLGGAR